MARPLEIVRPITDEPEIIEVPEPQNEDPTPTTSAGKETEKTDETVKEKADMAESIYSRGPSCSPSRERYTHPIETHYGRDYSPPPRSRGFASRIHQVPILIDAHSLNGFIQLDDVCVDTAINQMVYITNHPFHAADLDKMSWIFNIEAQDTWVRKPTILATAEGYKADFLGGKEKEKRGRGRYAYDNVYERYDDGYDPLGRPNPSICRLGNALRVFKRDEKKFGTEKVKFVTAVQKNNAAWAKLVVSHSRKAALVDIFHEMMCGNSIQLVGAVLTDVVVPLEAPQKKVRFQRLGSLKEAQEVPSGVVGVIC